MILIDSSLFIFPARRPDRRFQDQQFSLWQAGNIPNIEWKISASALSAPPRERS